MIAYIKGVLAEKNPGYAIVEAAGVGYMLSIPLSTYDRLPRTGEEVKLLAAHIVREDDEQLYGFTTPAERELFAKLTQVSGVGPKIALSILSGAGMGELSLAIASADSKRLAAIKGVGKKTAEKIVIELKDKINAIEALAMAGKTGQGKEQAFLLDARKALSALGFADDIASKMVAKVVAANPAITDTQEIIRHALRS
ncbi:MAG: Holliday junction branch migration protein RuvA [Kiritimatiellae bacterium]|nr:Holliday junction branch migration protein RuvA [Kiritimatiellia bacterium]